MAQADCGIFLSRAEGWNLELLEMMSMNKPVITTNYSAHTEFCNPSNAHLVDIDELESAYDGKWFFGYGEWAKIGPKQKEQAIELMRHVYKSNIRTNIAGLETGKHYSWQNSARHLIKCI
jgi:glycosyltransferase involved in cell wall biosynthesis